MYMNDDPFIIQTFFYNQILSRVTLLFMTFYTVQNDV
jgi:hypothetical protein